jgi:acetylornithine/succinyldiaminopimelate/putrescine aminotransferase
MKPSALEPAVEPDVEALLGVIRRTRPPRRVHHLELFLDPEVKDALAARFALEEGVLLLPAGEHGHVVELTPSVSLTAAQAALAVDVVARSVRRALT